MAIMGIAKKNNKMVQPLTIKNQESWFILIHEEGYDDIYIQHKSEYFNPTYSSDLGFPLLLLLNNYNTYSILISPDMRGYFLCQLIWNELEHQKYGKTTNY